MIVLLIIALQVHNSGIMNIGVTIKGRCWLWETRVRKTRKKRRKKLKRTKLLNKQIPWSRQ